MLCSEIMSRSYHQGERARTAARTGAAIDAAAIREVTRHGYAAVRVADIAARAGVAPRTLYLRAPSKERLVEGALRARAAALTLRVERWRPRATAAEAVIGELVALHERTYRTEKALLEALVEGGLPPSGAGILRALDDVRLAIIDRTMTTLARRRALRLRTADATALAHALLSYPTWRVALTGPASRRAPRLVAAALRAAVL